MKRRKFTEEDVQYACENYNKMTSKEIAKHIGCSRSWVLKVWMENNLSGKDIGRQYYSNFDYFEKIDTYNKAYVLGFIAADGCVYQYKDLSKQKMLSISLQSSDEKIMKDMLEDMNSDNVINRISFINKRGTKQYVSNFQITSNKMCEDLINLGIHPRKTHTLKLDDIFNKIPNEFHASFLRGYFDGDGSINIGNRNNTLLTSYKISITLPKKSSDVLVSFLNKLNISSSYKKDYDKIDSGDICIYSTVNKYLFLNFIYKDVLNNDSNLYLERKYDLSMDFCKLVNTNATNRISNIKAVNELEKLKQNWSL